ncbi:hypothetical protein I7I48_01234 [Histoplasma ohiense]|nr:hypothetical protein I7I48_01234 [Histoplasma ohiense (nom. inval.)]
MINSHCLPSITISHQAGCWFCTRVPHTRCFLLSSDYSKIRRPGTNRKTSETNTGDSAFTIYLNIDGNGVLEHL